MNEPVIETGIAFLRERLRTQLVIPTSTFEPASIIEDRPNLAEAKVEVALPAIFLWTGEEAFDHDDGLGRTYVHVVFNIIALRLVEVGVAQAGRLMVADVLRALTNMNHSITHATGPSILACIPQKAVTYNGLSGSRAGGHIAFEVIARTKFGDPCTVA